MGAFVFGYPDSQALRDERWKLHLPMTPKQRNWGKHEPESPLMFFDLKADIGETKNVAANHPEVVERLFKEAQAIRPVLGDRVVQAKGRRRVGRVADPSLLRAGNP